MTRHTQNAAAAAERVSFQLRYAREETRRWFGPGFIEGDRIDNADPFSKNDSPGEWCGTNLLWRLPASEWDANDLPQDAWIEHYFEMAIAEVVHEGLEWFRVDGAPFLDPHDSRVESEIYRLTEEFARRLAELRTSAIEAPNTKRSKAS